MYYEQFNKSHARRILDTSYHWKLKDKDINRFHILESYATKIAIVDNKTKRIYLGCCAYLSRTTTKQFNGMVYKWYNGYEIVAKDSRKYKLFVKRYGISDNWDEFGGWC